MSFRFSNLYARKLFKLNHQQILCLQLTIRIIDCTPELIERNRNFVATQGLQKANIGINGTIHLYESKGSSEKVRFILITG